MLFQLDRKMYIVVPILNNSSFGGNWCSNVVSEIWLLGCARFKSLRFAYYFFACASLCARLGCILGRVLHSLMSMMHGYGYWYRYNTGTLMRQNLKK